MLGEKKLFEDVTKNFTQWKYTQKQNGYRYYKFPSNIIFTFLSSHMNDSCCFEGYDTKDRMVIGTKSFPLIFFPLFYHCIWMILVALKVRQANGILLGS